MENLSSKMIVYTNMLLRKRRTKSHMQENTDILKTPLESEQDFPKFLNRVRTEENIYLEKLAKGLMNASHLARIEKGQRPVRKNMRDRLLGRLGIASELYENLLDIEDYKAWEQQRNILSAIEQKDTQTAQRLIAEYERQPPIKDKIKYQFCLMMKAEVLKQQEAAPEEISECYEKAVKLTVPNVEHLRIEESLLSIQEINMILEYEACHKAENFADKCKALMLYVENAVYDNWSKVKIYPKIAYYHLRDAFSGQNEQIPEKLNESLRICTQAIEMLRDTGRAFYLLELLEIKCKLLEQSENAPEEYKESEELAKLLRKLYAEYELPAYMQDCTYLYRQRWVFYVGDVLRIRRKMYGLTQEGLSKGICSARTLRRTEKMKANMQQEELSAMLRRLGLSKEYQRISLVTNNREVVKLNEELAICRNNYNLEKARELLQQIEDKISVKIPENRQYIIEAKASLDWIEGRITQQEFVAKEEEALQCTLNTETLFHTDELYLTEMEMSCIRKKIQGLEGTAKRNHIDVLLQFFESYKKRHVLSDCVVMYEFVVGCLASELGNIGEYQSATDLNKKVLRESLRCKRVWVIADNLYGMLWNEQEQKIKMGEVMEKEKMTEGLKQCVILSHFCKRNFYENFFREKMHQL